MKCLIAYLLFQKKLQSAFNIEPIEITVGGVKQKMTVDFDKHILKVENGGSAYKIKESEFKKNSKGTKFTKSIQYCINFSSFTIDRITCVYVKIKFTFGLKAFAPKYRYFASFFFIYFFFT